MYNAAMQEFLKTKEHRCFLHAAIRALRKQHAGSLLSIWARTAMLNSIPAPAGRRDKAAARNKSAACGTLKLVVVTATDGSSKAVSLDADRLRDMALAGADALFREITPPDLVIKRGREEVRAGHVLSDVRGALAGINLEIKVARHGDPVPPSLDPVWRLGFLPLDAFATPTPFSPAEAALALAEAGVPLAPNERVERTWVEKDTFAPRGTYLWRWAVAVEGEEWPEIHEPRRRVLYLTTHGNSWYLAKKEVEVPTGSRKSRCPPPAPAVEKRQKQGWAPILEKYYQGERSLRMLV